MYRIERVAVLAQQALIESVLQNLPQHRTQVGEPAKNESNFSANYRQSGGHSLNSILPALADAVKGVVTSKIKATDIGGGFSPILLPSCTARCVCAWLEEYTDYFIGTNIYYFF